MKLRTFAICQKFQAFIELWDAVRRVEYHRSPMIPEGINHVANVGLMWFESNSLRYGCGCRLIDRRLPMDQSLPPRPETRLPLPVI